MKTNSFISLLAPDFDLLLSAWQKPELEDFKVDAYKRGGAEHVSLFSNMFS